MIGVNFLYEKVNEILVKNQSGYSSNSEFNNDLVVAQSYLMDFLLPNNEDNRVHESLVPFIKKVSGIGTITLPTDWLYKLNAKAHSPMSGFPEHPGYFMATDEDYLTLSSPIRKPDRAKKSFRYKIDSDGITFYPQDVYFTASYIRKPAVAVRVVTLDTTNDVENYTATGTVDLEWPELETARFVEILTYLRGVQVNKSEVIQWIASKKAIA